MSKEMTVILVGVWIIILPYLGIHSSWKTFLLVITGLGLIGVGFLLRAEALGQGRAGNGKDHYPFVENSTAQITHNYSNNDKEGINSLN